MEEEKKCSKINQYGILGSTKFEISHEDKLIRIGHHRKMTSKEDNYTRRKPYKKTGRSLSGRRHHRNLTLQEEIITKRQPYKNTGRRPTGR